MGINDYQKDRDWIISHKFIGDITKAKSLRKLGNKLIEKVKGSLDDGANIGVGTSGRFQVDEETTIDIQVQPGATNPMASMTITAGKEEIPEGEEPPPERETILCPQLPFGQPGARMFTELFGHFRAGGGLYNNSAPPVFEESIMQSEPNENRFFFEGMDFGCETGSGANEHRRSFVEFDQPIKFLGLPAQQKVWYANSRIFFNGPHNSCCGIFPTIFDMPPGCGPLDPPHDEVFNSSQWNTEMFGNIDGQSYTFGSTSAGGCYNVFIDEFNEIAIRGHVPMGALDLDTGSAEVMQRPFIAFNFTRPVTALQASGLNVLGVGTNFGRSQTEVVMLFLDPTAGVGDCAFALGYFMGGQDGALPMSYPTFLDIYVKGDSLSERLDFKAVDIWWHPLLCGQWKWVEIQGGRFPGVVGMGVVGADVKAKAYLGPGGVSGLQAGSEVHHGGTQGSNSGAKNWINGRSMWFLFDGAGDLIPGQGGINDGFPHMVFN